MMPSESPRRWLLQKLTDSCRRQQVSLGDEVWQLDDLLRLIEFTARSAATFSQSCQVWCESLPLLGSEWYPQWQQHDLALLIRFEPLVPEPDPEPLWWLLQLWHHSVQENGAQWRLEWPQRMRTETEVVPLHLLAASYGRRPALHLTLSANTSQPNVSWQPLHGALLTVLHRLHRLGAQPRGLLERVKQLLEQTLPRQPSLQELALQLQLPVRSLQRQLHSFGTTHSTLLEDVRRNRAVSLLCHEQYSATQVGLQLGYQDAPSFQRAFRRWFGMTPGRYRQRYFEHDDSEALPAVSLYYALNQLQQHSLRQYSGARIWICLHNRAFDKSVQVLCEDKDGIWRPYAATFERFLAADIELWSTPSLPVHDPLRFRIEYRVGGELHLDNNGGLDYCLDAPVLLGSYAAVCHQLIRLPTTGQPQWLVRLFTRSDWPRAEAVWNSSHGEVRQRMSAERCGPAWSWYCQLNPPDQETPVWFEFGSEQHNRLVLDNGGEGFLPPRL